MKDFVASVLLTGILIIIFSVVCFPEDALPLLGGIGTEHPGDSGLIIPGDGDLVAKTIIERENAQEPTVAYEKKSTADKIEAVQETSEETQETTKEIKEERNKMGDIMLAFWHGVATVLIGETVALMVAIAWLKIKRKDSGK